VAVFAACGVYQLSSLKDRCLTHCRSPRGLLLHYGSYRGRFRDVRAGAHHGGYCLGCCWALMVVLIAAGVMNVAAMAGLAALVLIEKLWRWGPAAGRLAGAAALALAVATIWLPWACPRPARRTANDDELTPKPRSSPAGSPKPKAHRNAITPCYASPRRLI
jgi:predicted metal-binding membrane protein